MEMERRKKMAPIEKFAWLMDEAFRIPGTNFRIGWDSIIGLIPGVGEVVMLVTQYGFVFYAVSHYQIPNVIVGRMIINVLVDSFFGAIPIVGDVFDMFFKANKRNLKLIREVKTHAELGVPTPTKKHTAYLITFAFVLLAIFSGFVALTYWVIRTLLLVVS